MKIYDEITNEELTSPDLSAGYLYTARRVAEHVPESREVMQGTVTEDDPKGLEHIISGYDVYEDCQLYHRLHRGRTGRAAAGRRCEASSVDAGRMRPNFPWMLAEMLAGGQCPPWPRSWAIIGAAPTAARRVLRWAKCRRTPTA